MIDFTEDDRIHKSQHLRVQFCRSNKQKQCKAALSAEYLLRQSARLADLILQYYDFIFLRISNAEAHAVSIYNDEMYRLP